MLHHGERETASPQLARVGARQPAPTSPSSFLSSEVDTSRPPLIERTTRCPESLSGIEPVRARGLQVSPKKLQRLVVRSRSDDHFEEYYQLLARPAQMRIDGDDTAERGDRVTGKRTAVRISCSPPATPHGFMCFTMTAAGSSNSATH